MRYRYEALGGGTEALESELAELATRLPARWTVLREGVHGVRVEVGASEGLAGAGPTYDLELVTAATNVCVLPNVRMGVYDDYDEDFGVPWAFPLAPFRRGSQWERSDD